MFGQKRGPGVTPAMLKSGLATACGLNLQDIDVLALFRRFDTNGSCQHATARHRRCRQLNLLRLCRLLAGHCECECECVCFHTGTSFRFPGDGYISIQEFLQKCTSQDYQPEEVRFSVGVSS
jgi:hypothetical protein